MTSEEENIAVRAASREATDEINRLLADGKLSDAYWKAVEIQWLLQGLQEPDADLVAKLGTLTFSIERLEKAGHGVALAPPPPSPSGRRLWFVSWTEDQRRRTLLAVLVVVLAFWVGPAVRLEMRKLAYHRAAFRLLEVMEGIMARTKQGLTCRQYSELLVGKMYPATEEWSQSYRRVLTSRFDCRARLESHHELACAVIAMGDVEKVWQQRCAVTSPRLPSDELSSTLSGNDEALEELRSTWERAATDLDYARRFLERGQ